MNRNDKGSGKYPLPLSFLFLYQVLQILVSSDALQLVLDNLLDVLLYLIVVVLNSLLHAVIAIGILEIVNDRDRLIMAFLSLLQVTQGYLCYLTELEYFTSLSTSIPT